MSSSTTTDQPQQQLPPIIFEIGPPGVGKGVVGAYLSNLFNLHTIVAGDLLRNEVKAGTKIGKEIIGPLLADGKIIPSEITIELIKKKVFEKSQEKFLVDDKSAEVLPQGILLDGFPRKIDQSNMFEQSIAKAQAVVYFSCKEEVMLKRLLSRGREDDQIDIIRKRFQANQEQCEPVREMFAQQGRLHTLDTNGEIQEVCESAKKLFCQVLGFKIMNENVEIPKV